MQPIKKNNLYEDIMSSEMHLILKDIKENGVKEFPINNITTEYFIFSCLANTNNMLYKALNSFLNTMSIVSIQAELKEMIEHKNINTIIKPMDRLIFSPGFKNVLNKCAEYIKETNDEYITSDHVLVNALELFDDIALIFASKGYTIEKAKDTSRKLHSLADQLMNKTKKNNNQSNAKQNSVTMVINGGNMNDLPILGNIFGGNPMGSGNGTKNALSNYTENLIEYSKNNEFTKLIGRNDIISDIVTTLNRRDNNNVVLVGEHGVGKTKIVQGLASMIAKGKCSVSLKEKKILKVNLNEIVAGTNLRGMLEERFSTLAKEAKKDENIILFFDNIHQYISKKSNEEDNIEGFITNIFNDSKIQSIITTTPSGYKKVFNDTKFSTNFKKINIEEPSINETFDIIKNIKDTYENFHTVKYDDDLLKDTIKLCKRYIIENNLPASAIDIMDEVGSKKKLSIYENDIIINLQCEINEILKERDMMLKTAETDKVNALNEILSEKQQQYFNLINLTHQSDNNITINDIYEVISNITKIPVGKINVSEKETILNIENILKNNIIGQDDAMHAIAQSIKRSKVGLAPKGKPIASFFFNGPSGCGKTLAAKTLATEIFGDEKYLIRFDMSEYSDRTATNKLIGSSAGYVGYERGGLLTEAIKNKRHCVLLIDEIEKANEEIYNLFLQVLDEGCLTDNIGQKVDFRDTVIIFTSNIGAKRASQEKGIGFSVDDNQYSKDVILKELKNKFPPEFINRLDDVIYFNKLDNDVLRSITSIEINKLCQRLKDLKLFINYDDSVIDFLINQITEDDKEYGARPIIRIIQKEIENKITDLLLLKEYPNDYLFNITVENNTLNIC